MLGYKPTTQSWLYVNITTTNIQLVIWFHFYKWWYRNIHELVNFESHIFSSRHLMFLTPLWPHLVNNCLLKSFKKIFWLAYLPMNFLSNKTWKSHDLLLTTDIIHGFLKRSIQITCWPWDKGTANANMLTCFQVLLLTMALYYLNIYPIIK